MLMRQFFIFLTCCFCFVFIGNAQIFEPEGLNMPGQWDGYSNPPTVDALRNPNQSPSGDITLITEGNRRYQTTIHCAISGGDVAPGNFNWLFTSGPSPTGYFNNKWAGVNVVSNTIQTYTVNAGSDNNISATDGKWYTINFEDSGYTNTRAIFMETTGAPVGFDSSSAIVQTPTNNITDGNTVTVIGTLDTAPNAELRIFIRYSTDGFTTSNVVEMTNSIPSLPAEVDGTIPGSANTVGATIDYYLFTTTADASTITDVSEYDLISIDIENNNGSNYSYTVVNNQTTSALGNWNDPATWTSGSVPNTDDVVELNHNVTVTNNVNQSGNITINSPHVLSISPGHSLKFTGSTFTNNGGVLMTSSSSTFSSFIPSVSSTLAGTGGYEYFRHTNSNANGNDLISPPLSNDTFGAFATRNNATLFSDSGNANIKLFGPFTTSATTPAYVEYVVGTDDAISLISGKGYRGATTSGNSLAFIGDVEKSDVSITIVNNGETDFKSWNLVGNPFASYVQLGVDLLNPTTLNSLDANYQSFYFYNAGTSGSYPGATIQGNWAIVNVTYVLSAPNTAIAPGQGFFVKAKSGGGSVLFEESSRFTATDAASSDDGIAGRNTNPTNIARAKIGLSTANDNSEIDIYFTDNATLGLDPGYDVGGFGGSSFGIFTNLLDGDAGIDMAIQSLPYSSLNNVSIPLGVNMTAGTQFTLELDNVYSSLPDGIDLYLDDTLENSSTLLNSGGYVNTPATSLSGTGRFYLRFSNSVLSATESSLDYVAVYTNQSTRTINISGQLDAGTIARVFDIQGREVITKKLSSNSILQRLDSNDLHTGAYIVQLNSKTESKSLKLIIR